MATLEALKQVVRMFNQEVIERGNPEVAKSIFADGFINHSAPPGAPNGPEGMLNTFNNVLRPALKNIRVEIQSQVAEGDLVTTRKVIKGRHEGTLMGVEATGKNIEIHVIDMVRIKNSQYAEHWGINDLPAVLASLKE